MQTNRQAPVSQLRVIIAFAIVYLVWGSTYFFIRVAIQDIPALLMVSMRFFTAGLLLFLWCLLRKVQLFEWVNIRPALVSGLLLLFLGNGAVVWAEQYLPSSLVAVFAASSPIWFVVLDRPNWKINLSNKETVTGLLIGFIGVVFLFSENATHVIRSKGSNMAIGSMAILILGSLSWAGGSLVSKYFSRGHSHSANAAWQMLAAGIAFLPLSLLRGETNHFHWQQVSVNSWFALIYLITLGSLAGYSAYAWLLQVRPATQVSTHAYVNPVVAVILGTLLAGEKMSVMQFTGLTIILISVLLINISRYRKQRQPFATSSKVVCEI
jgi:drug/metabolite transporter (DMT)-like permease